MAWWVGSSGEAGVLGFPCLLEKWKWSFLVTTGEGRWEGVLGTREGVFLGVLGQGPPGRLWLWNFLESGQRWPRKVREEAGKRRRWSRGKGKKLYFSQGTQSLHGGCSKQVTGHPGGQEGKGSGSSQNERRFRKRCTPEWKEKPWKVRKPEVSSEDRGLPRWLRQWRVCLQHGRPRFNP